MRVALFNQFVIKDYQYGYRILPLQKDPKSGEMVEGHAFAFYPHLSQVVKYIADQITNEKDISDLNQWLEEYKVTVNKTLEQIEVALC